MLKQTDGTAGRIDVIGARLLNVVSPTGPPEIDALSGTRSPDLVIDYRERRIR